SLADLYVRLYDYAGLRRRICHVSGRNALRLGEAHHARHRTTGGVGNSRISCRLLGLVAVWLLSPHAHGLRQCVQSMPQTRCLASVTAARDAGGFSSCWSDTQAMTITYHLEPDLSVDEFRAVLIRSTLAARRPVDRAEILQGRLRHAGVIC